MATTAQEIINAAAENIGVLGVGITLPGEETARFLASLNDMLDDWNAERTLAYVKQDESFTLPAAATSRTIGPTGQLVTVRPERIEWAYVRLDDTDYPIEIVTAHVWAQLPDKASTSATGQPGAVYYEATVPNGTLRFDRPADQDYEIHIGTWGAFTAFSAPGTSVDLPPGYKTALVMNLTVRMAPKYERSVPAEISALAINTKRKIMTVNAAPLTPAHSEAVFISGSCVRFGGNILNGGG